MSDCCKEENLHYFEADDVWPYEIWQCNDCNKYYSVELIRDFKNKEEV